MSDDPFVYGDLEEDYEELGADCCGVLLILGGLAVIATTLSDSATVGKVFSLGLVAVLLVLLGLRRRCCGGLKCF